MQASYIRHIDTAGRVIIPKKLRKVLDISKDDAIEIISTDKNTIILKKYISSYEAKVQTIERIIDELKREGYGKNSLLVIELQEAIEIIKQKNLQPTVIDCK